MMVRVGNFDETNIDKNAICVDNFDGSKRAYNKYYCHEIPMPGRYVIVTITEASNGNKIQIYANYVRVYALGEDDPLDSYVLTV